MEKSQGKLESNNRGERVSTKVFCIGLNGRRKKRAIVMVRVRYKYLPALNGQVSRGSASLQVRHYRTRPDSKE